MNVLKKIHGFLASQVGINLILLVKTPIGLAKYLCDLLRFFNVSNSRIKLMPCLHDAVADCGTVNSEYFWQDLLVAQMIFCDSPKKHVDVGSRIDGFVAHVASFREIEVFDVRPLPVAIPNVVFRNADLMRPLVDFQSYADSVSCLHALEHFGLGRYGDTLSPEGYATGFSNVSAILRSGGVMYLSVPIGTPRVEFNAHRVFSVEEVLHMAEVNGLVLRSAKQIGPKTLVGGSPYQIVDIMGSEGRTNDSLGLFVFIKR